MNSEVRKGKLDVEKMEVRQECSLGKRLSKSERKRTTENYKTQLDRLSNE